MGKVKVLVVGDLHGRHELATKAYDQFRNESYDKLIFIGDYTDSYDLPNEDIIKTILVILQAKKENPEKVVLLVGNHDEPYFHNNPREYPCQGFRSDIHLTLSQILIPNRREFNYIYGISNFMFTHAGISHGWYLKHFDLLEMWAERMDLDISDINDIYKIVDNIKCTSDKHILLEIGPDRGGLESNHGGPLWCDKEELLTQGPLIGLNQIVGHTSQHFITRIHTFENNKKYADTSVTFIDCLSYRHQFLKLEIND